MATGLADVMSSILGKGDPAPGQSNKKYDEINYEAGREATGLYQRGREYKVDAPTIQNKYQDENRSTIAANMGQQRYLTDSLRGIMEGRDTTGAQAVSQRAADQAIQTQMAAARSARGAGGQAAALRGAQQQAAEIGGRAANDAAQLQSQQAMLAAQIQAGVFGDVGRQAQAQYQLEQMSAIEQARMQQEAEAQRQRMELGLTGLSQNAANRQLVGMGQQHQGNLGTYNAQQQADQAAMEAGGGILGAGLGAMAGLMMMSDDRAKSNEPDFSPISFGSGGGVGNAMSSGFSGGARLGQGLGSIFQSSAPAVGSQDWAAQVNAQPVHQYQPMSGPAVQPADPFAPAGTNTPAWLSDYMSSGEADKVSDGQKLAMMGSMMKSFKSDERAKLDKREAAAEGRRLVDQFMDSLDPLAYHYKDPADEPRQPATGGKYLGVSAQDMERAPEVGDQIVVNTPGGKRVSTRAATSAALASIARLAERVSELEGKRRVG